MISTFLAPLLVVGAWQIGTRAVANRNTGDSGRLEFASIALDLIQEKPLAGGGSRSYFFDSFAKWNPKELWIGGGDIEYVHNEYLQAAVDYGLVGLALLLGVVGIVMFRGVALLAVGENHETTSAGIALGSMAALWGMGVQAFFSFVFHVLPDVMLLGCCIAWLVGQPWALRVDRKCDVPEFGFCTKQGLMGFALAAATVALCWRDAVAWMMLYPKLDYATTDELSLMSRYESAVAVRPDFRLYSEQGKNFFVCNQKDQFTAEQKKEFMQHAIASLEMAIKRAPDSYEDQVNLALMYDYTGQFEKSAPLYRRVLPILDPREMHYGARYFHARHLASRANILWYQREPEKALLLFIQARDELKRATSTFRYADPEVTRLIQKSIDFLEGANIKPAADEPGLSD